MGPTSSGKTALSIEIAKQCNAEVLSADSRQVYRGLDLLSGKVTREEMEDIRHHLLDIADPRITFSVSDYKDAGTIVLDALEEQKILPVIAGGTGFYIDALLGRTSLAEVPPNPTLRQGLEKKTLTELQEKLETLDPDRFATIDSLNPRRLIRAIEIAETLGKNPAPTNNNAFDVLWIGLEIPLEELREKIALRVHERLNAGMVEELRDLMTQGLSFERMEELGLECRYIGRHLQNKLSYEEMVDVLTQEIQHYAKRQYTWFRKNKNIQWFHPSDVVTIEKAVENFLKTRAD